MRFLDWFKDRKKEINDDPNSTKDDLDRLSEVMHSWLPGVSDSGSCFSSCGSQVSCITKVFGKK
jgi:hypothetical protein